MSGKERKPYSTWKTYSSEGDRGTKEFYLMLLKCSQLLTKRWDWKAKEPISDHWLPSSHLFSQWDNGSIRGRPLLKYLAEEWQGCDTRGPTGLSGRERNCSLYAILQRAFASVCCWKVSNLYLKTQADDSVLLQRAFVTNWIQSLKWKTDQFSVLLKCLLQS